MPSANNINRIGMLINPASTGAKLPQTRANIHNLEEAFPGRTYQVLTDPSYEATQEELAKKAEPGDIICGFGGDSLAFIMANALLTDVAYKAFKAGNGSEFAKMTGSECGLSPSQAILQGDIRPVRPIKLTQEVPGEGLQDMRALAYFGLHTSAAITRKMNDPTYRSRALYKFGASRLLMEMYQTLATGFSMPALPVERAGEIITLQEFSAVNGDIMGKLGRIPNKLDHEGVYGTTVPVYSRSIAERVAAASFGAAALLTGRTAGFDIMTSEAVSFRVLDKTYLHADGEPFPVVAGTRMTIGPDTQTINILFNERAA